MSVRRRYDATNKQQRQRTVHTQDAPRGQRSGRGCPARRDRWRCMETQRRSALKFLDINPHPVMPPCRSDEHKGRIKVKRTTAQHATPRTSESRCDFGGRVVESLACGENKTNPTVNPWYSPRQLARGIRRSRQAPASAGTARAPPSASGSPRGTPLPSALPPARLALARLPPTYRRLR